MYIIYFILSKNNMSYFFIQIRLLLNKDLIKAMDDSIL